MSNLEQAQAIALALTPGVGWKTLQRLLTVFGSLGAILAADGVALQTVPGVGPKTASAIHAVDLPRITADLERFKKRAIHAVTWQDADYPVRLVGVADLPLALFYRGRLTIPLNEAPTIAIVGTRDPQPESLEFAETLAAEFAGHGWTVISGLARGIDSAAHRGALAASGTTVAVLGGGLNAVYPPENRGLAQQIAGGGALLCECHPDSNPSASGLTRRNRIISGLSRAVIVIEAGATSGALHAARKAHGQGRPVFAVENGSAGNAWLLAGFAHKVESAAQVIEYLAL